MNNKILETFADRKLFEQGFKGETLTLNSKIGTVIQSKVLKHSLFLVTQCGNVLNSRKLSS